MALFWISRHDSVEEFELPISAATRALHDALTSRDARMAFWERETGDARFAGPFTALVVEFRGAD